MQRIAFVIWSLEPGGAEKVVIRLAAALDRSRFEPIVCCLNERGRFAPQVERAGVEVIAFGKRGALDLRMVRALAATLRERRIDVVHTHLWGANLWGRLAARLAGVPRVVVTEHSVDTWKSGLHIAIDRLLSPLASDLVAVSGQVREFYESRSVGRGRWQVIYNGVESQALPRARGAAYAELGIAADEPVVGLLGRLNPEKAPNLFLDAFERAAKRVPRLRALVIGDGPLRAEAEAHAKRLGIAERVVFCGVRQDVPELLAGMDVLASSSTREGFSIAILEAMTAGVPVVATRVGGNPELVEAGVSGELVESGDAAALAERIAAFLQDPARAAAIRRAARERVAREFSLEKMVAAYQNIYAVRPAPVAERTRAA